MRTLLLRCGQDEWEQLLPQIMRTFRDTPHLVTGKTANLIMLSRELQLPDQLQLQPTPAEITPQNEYCRELVERLEVAHKVLREQQKAVRQKDHEEPFLFSPENILWLENPKLHAKFQGSYTVVKSWTNHMYQIERQGQTSIQNECHLKTYRPRPVEVGRALEPN